MTTATPIMSVILTPSPSKSAAMTTPQISIATALARESAEVILTDVDNAGGESLTTELRAAGHRAW